MIALVFICWMLAAACNAVMDVLAFKFKTSVFKDLNPDWWNPSISWRNKYKDKNPNKGERFPGSTTALSFITDAWHLFQFLSNSFLALSVVFVFLHYTSINWWQALIMFLGLKVIWGLIFEALYSKGLRKYPKKK